LIEKVADTFQGSTRVGLLLLSIFLQTPLWLVPAFKGNKWREDNLSNRGYKLLNTVQADNPDAAVAQSTKSA
jgi:hypothetical protein